MILRKIICQERHTVGGQLTADVRRNRCCDASVTSAQAFIAYHEQAKYHFHHDARADFVRLPLPMNILTSVSATRIAPLSDRCENNDHGTERIYPPVDLQTHVQYSQKCLAIAKKFATFSATKHIILKIQLIHATRLS